MPKPNLIDSLGLVGMAMQYQKLEDFAVAVQKKLKLESFNIIISSSIAAAWEIAQKRKGLDSV